MAFVSSSRAALNALLVKQGQVSLCSSRGFVAGWAVCKEDKGTVDSMAHGVGDKIEKAGENLKERAKDMKEPAESGVKQQVRSTAESIGEATQKAGDKIEHSMDDDKGSKLNERNLEDKQVLSN